MSNHIAAKPGEIDLSHGQRPCGAHGMAGRADGHTLCHRLVDAEQLADVGGKDVADRSIS